ncbi:DUF2336 domain-containing protein [Pseudochrobactrum sp. MP213Fo]|uniref:DUF2336 domain-containing protein n=1 Tax=Pseudochrobactrum sp. MP213Fo TaxID=3022250 RepID=UPI003B9E140B
MTADQFRALEIVSGSGHSAHHKTDDLLAATVAGFTSLTRPGRHESQQFEDLAMPLLETASPRARRQVSAILAQHDVAPRKLVLALANDTIEVAAPLLLRSPVLTTADLADIIASRGLSHTRIIARRHPLDAMLLPVLQSFDDPIIEQSLNTEPLAINTTVEEPAKPQAQSSHYASAPPANRQEPAKTMPPLQKPAATPQSFPAHDLRALALPALTRPSRADYMIDMALLIDTNLFRSALADALGVSYVRAENIIGTWPNSQLPLALKAIGLSAQDTYLILTAVLGTIHGERDQLREFVHIYRSISTEQALNAVSAWKAADMAADVNDRLRNKLRDLVETSSAEDFTTPANNDHENMQKKAQ